MGKNYHTENKSFMVYKDWEEYLGMLSCEEAGMLFKSLFAFASRGEEANLDGILKMLFIMMRNTLDRDGKKWEKVCDARELAKSARESKKSNSDDTDKEKDTDKDTATDTEKEPPAERRERPAGAKTTKKSKSRNTSKEHSYDLDKMYEYILYHTPKID